MFLGEGRRLLAHEALSYWCTFNFLFFYKVYLARSRIQKKPLFFFLDSTSFLESCLHEKPNEYVHIHIFYGKKKQLGEKRVPYIAVESDKLLHKYIVSKKKAG